MNIQDESINIDPSCQLIKNKQIAANQSGLVCLELARFKYRFNTRPKKTAT